jgi:hypothetical protein
MEYDDFKNRYAQVLPKCNITSFAEATVIDRNFAFQENYQNPTIRRFILQCKGNIVSTQSRNIDVLITDPKNIIVAAVDNPKRMILDADQFKKAYMYKCLNTKQIYSKHVSFAPDFEDSIGLTQHLNTCDTILLDINNSLDQKRDFIIYDEVKDPGGVAAKANPSVIYHVNKSAVVISSTHFMNNFVNMNIKAFFDAVSQFPDNSLKGMTIAFAPGYIDSIDLESYIATRAKFTDLTTDKPIDRDFIIYNHDRDAGGVAARAAAAVKVFTLDARRTVKAVLISDKEFLKVHVRKHATIYNSAFANKIRNHLVGGSKSVKSGKAVKACK